MEKLLIVDDEISILNLCRTILGDTYEVQTRSDPKEALKALAEDAYDVMITDLKMPQMDGAELMRRAKTVSPDTEIIVFTGQATVETANRNHEDRAYDYVLKPFNIQHLMLTVQQCVTQSKLKKNVTVFRETLYLYQFADEIINKQNETDLLKFILERRLRPWPRTPDLSRWLMPRTTTPYP